MKTFQYLFLATFCGLIVSSCTTEGNSQSKDATEATKAVVTLEFGNEKDQETTTVRFASFNVALNRKESGQLIKGLESGRSRKFNQLAEVIQRIRPHVILLNEVDYDEAGKAIKLFQSKYLAVSQNKQWPIEFAHVFTAPVNTGVASGIDINQDGEIKLPDDGFGFGGFPGQYGMVVLSQFPIDTENVRTFQKFLWKDMPDAMLPTQPETKKAYYPDDVLNKMRLSSKSHWDVPIVINGNTVHLICSHPTPPVFDGPEDRNGCRNHDEVRMIVDYISDQADYLYDDNGKKGGLPAGSRFVIVGDLNADPHDGDSRKQAARRLTENALIDNSQVPSSKGAVEAAKASGGKNDEHVGPHAYDTGDFNDDYSGNVRVDYCLPSKTLKLLDCGVFWPGKDEAGADLNQASDHHLVWIDVAVPK